MHRPERWRFVQFSTAAPGQAVFRPDPSWAIRERLMSVYKVEKERKAKGSDWTTSLEALGLSGEPPIPGAGPLRIRLTESGYEASMTREGRPRQTLTIREDSRLTVTTEDQ